MVVIDRQSMKRLYTFNAGDVAGLSLLRAELDLAGITYVTRNDGLFSAAGGVPVTECHPEVWVLENEHFDRADRILRDWLTPAKRGKLPWQCPECAEELDAQFESCWNCGASRPG